MLLVAQQDVGGDAEAEGARCGPGGGGEQQAVTRVQAIKRAAHGHSWVLVVQVARAVAKVVAVRAHRVPVGARRVGRAGGGVLAQGVWRGVRGRRGGLGVAASHDDVGLRSVEADN